METANLPYLNELFIKHAVSGDGTSYQTLDKGKKDKLYLRKYMLDESFQFTSRKVQRLNDINQLLAERSLMAYDQAGKIQNNLQLEMKTEGSFINDYEIMFHLSLFAENKYRKIEELEGNPFFKCDILLPLYKVEENKDSQMIHWSLFENHNAYQHRDNHPLKHQYHCAFFHELYHHTFLSWQNIMDVEQIWIEINIILQNFSNLNG